MNSARDVMPPVALYSCSRMCVSAGHLAGGELGPRCWAGRPTDSLRDDTLACDRVAHCRGAPAYTTSAQLNEDCANLPTSPSRVFAVPHRQTTRRRASVGAWVGAGHSTYLTLKETTNQGLIVEYMDRARGYTRNSYVTFHTQSQTANPSRLRGTHPNQHPQSYYDLLPPSS